MKLCSTAMKLCEVSCTMSSTLGQCRPGTSVPQWGLPKRQVEKVPLSVSFSLCSNSLSGSITCLIQWRKSKLLLYKRLKNKIDYFHHKFQDKLLILALHTWFGSFAWLCIRCSDLIRGWVYVGNQVQVQILALSLLGWGMLRTNFLNLFSAIGDDDDSFTALLDTDHIVTRVCSVDDMALIPVRRCCPSPSPANLDPLRKPAFPAPDPSQRLCGRTVWALIPRGLAFAPWLLTGQVWALV